MIHHLHPNVEVGIRDELLFANRFQLNPSSWIKWRRWSLHLPHRKKPLGQLAPTKVHRRSLLVEYAIEVSPCHTLAGKFKYLSQI